MKKLLLVFLGAVLLVALSSTAALAGPKAPPNFGNYNPLNLPGEPPEVFWPNGNGVEKIKPPLGTYGVAPEASDSIHIVTDPLAVPGYPDTVQGWVTFWCQSTVGLQYHIGVIGLVPLSNYSVTALGGGSSGPVSLDLGTLHTDANGTGTVAGVERLVPDTYVLSVSVTNNATGTVVLASLVGDPQAFLVY